MTDPALMAWVLLHDVDRLPENSLVFARLQGELEIRAAYYFRTARESFHPRIMEEIVSLGHEVGYCYEDVSSAVRKIKNYELRMKSNAKRDSWSGRWGVLRGTCEDAAGGSGEDDLYARQSAEQMGQSVVVGAL